MTRRYRLDQVCLEFTCFAKENLQFPRRQLSTSECLLIGLAEMEDTLLAMLGVDNGTINVGLPLIMSQSVSLFLSKHSLISFLWKSSKFVRLLLDEFEHDIIYCRKVTAA